MSQKNDFSHEIFFAASAARTFPLLLSYLDLNLAKKTKRSYRNKKDLESDAISVNVVVIVVVAVALAVYAEKANFVNSCVFLVSYFLRFLLPHLIVFPFHISFKNIISKNKTATLNRLNNELPSFYSCCVIQCEGTFDGTTASARWQYWSKFELCLVVLPAGAQRVLSFHTGTVLPPGAELSLSLICQPTICKLKLIIQNFLW